MRSICSSSSDAAVHFQNVPISGNSSRSRAANDEERPCREVSGGITEVEPSSCGLLGPLLCCCWEHRRATSPLSAGSTGSEVRRCASADGRVLSSLSRGCAGPLPFISVVDSRLAAVTEDFEPSVDDLVDCDCPQSATSPSAVPRRLDCCFIATCCPCCSLGFGSRRGGGRRLSWTSTSSGTWSRLRLTLDDCSSDVFALIFVVLCSRSRATPASA